MAFDGFHRATHAAGIQTWGEAPKSAPRGFPRDHPRVRLLRHQSLVAGRRLDAGRRGIARDAALDHARRTRAASAALTAWLDAHVGESELPAETRLGRRR